MLDWAEDLGHLDRGPLSGLEGIRGDWTDDISLIDMESYWYANKAKTFHTVP